MVANIVSVSTAPLASLAAGIKDERVAESVTQANTALGRLINSSDFMDSLVGKSAKYVPPSSFQVISTLWGLMNANGDRTLTQPVLARAILEEGGSYAEVDALWAQLKPEGKEEVIPGDFAKNPYLVNALSLIYEPLTEAVDETRLQTAILTGGATSTGTLFDFYKGGGGGSGSLLDFFL